MQSGLINVYKTSGMTSQKVVSIIKRILRENTIDFGDKVGHLGTLDPDAEGVLPIAFGRATRLFDYFLDKVKVYYAVFKFGIETDTLDAGGEVINVDTNADIFEQDLLKVIPKQVGLVAQVPPLYSAKSVGGVRAYKLARNGQEFELKPKEVNIYSIDFIEKLEKNTFSFRITCGGGTYIRSIARDIGKDLGTYGIMQYLRREQSGIFELSTAKTVDELKDCGIENSILPISYALQNFEFVECDSFAEKLLNGVPVNIPDVPLNPFVATLNGEIAGIVSKTDDGVKFITRLL